MCDQAEWIIARKAVEVAQAEWDLVQMINAEIRVHRGVVEKTRALLVERGDRFALLLFESVLGEEDRLEPDLEKARALVEGA